jgi:hypothetical protein
MSIAEPTPDRLKLTDSNLADCVGSARRARGLFGTLSDRKVGVGDHDIADDRLKAEDS